MNEMKFFIYNEVVGCGDGDRLTMRTIVSFGIGGKASGV